MCLFVPPSWDSCQCSIPPIPSFDNSNLNSRHKCISATQMLSNVAIWLFFPFFVYLFADVKHNFYTEKEPTQTCVNITKSVYYAVAVEILMSSVDSSFLWGLNSQAYQLLSYDVLYILTVSFKAVSISFILGANGIEKKLSVDV